MKHALLSASGAHRWMACPGSARLEELLPEEKSSYADEGTLAHKLADLSLTYSLGRVSVREYNAAMEEITRDAMYNKSMQDHIDTFTAFITQLLETAKKSTPDAICLTEQRLDFSEYVPEGFGTGDVVIISDMLLQIIDLKYGQGIAVSAEKNPQMMLYALGAIHEYGHLYDVKDVKMIIYQPRLDSISEYCMTIAELLDWAEAELRYAAGLAYTGRGGYKAGGHCKFCRAKAVCRERAEENLRLARYDFQPPGLLSEDEIPDILRVADLLASWVRDIKDYALVEALKGTKWKGFKLVEGRSIRKYKDDSAVAEILKKEGCTDEEIFKTSLLGITDMEKVIGRKNFSRILEPAGLIIKPPGKPVLVPQSDNRPEITPAADAFSDGFTYTDEAEND